MSGERGVSVALVEGDGTGRIEAALGEAGLGVEPVESGDAAASAVEAGEADCVVACTAAAYERVRERSVAVPVAVAAGNPDRATLERVVDDAGAVHVDPGGALATTLPVRVERLAAGAGRGSAVAWQLADFPDGAVVEFDLESGALVEANDAFFETWGWSRERFADATLSDLRVTDITHELRGQGRGEEGEEELEWITDDGPVESLVAGALGGRHESREWHCRDADGNGFKSRVRVVADEAADRGYLVATTPDELGDVSAPAMMAHDEGSMLRSLLDHIPLSVYFKDTRSRHVLVSEDVVEPFVESPEGKILHTPEDVLGKTDFDLYPVEGAAESVAEDQAVMDTGEPLVDSIEEVHPPHGRPLYFKTTKAPWYGEGGRVLGIVGITVDITDQKRREKELDRQNERLDQFAGIVSHDLRNPLNVAKGRLELYRTRGDEENLEDVSEMHERMERLIQDVLTFAREGSRVEDVEWFDGRDIAERAWGGVDTAGATLEQDWAYRLGGDPDRLTRTFENLFRNAVEHGGSDVTVEVGTLDGEAGFYVQDDGPGVPEEHRDTLFEHGTTTEVDGTGYGLAIVREIAQAHGWEVTLAERDPERGARFEFTGVARGDSL